MKKPSPRPSGESMYPYSAPAEQAESWTPRRIVMLSLHTSPLAQAGRGDAGGLNVYVKALSSALAAQGHTVDIVTTDLDGEDSREPPSGESSEHSPVDAWHTAPDGVRVHVLTVCDRCKDDKSRLVECLDDLASRTVASVIDASTAAVDTVHSHYWISGIAGIEVARELGADLVHTMHTIAAVKAERDPSAAWDAQRHNAEQRIAVVADQITSNTHRETEDLQRIFGIGPERVTLVQPGTDLTIFHPAQHHAPAAGETFEISPQRPLRLTFAGRLQAHKGPQVAISAVQQLMQQMPGIPIQLTIAGRQSGPDALDIPALIQHAGIAETVVLTQPLPHPDLAELFRRSDVVVVPSYSESFGLVALEAMACGTPVLAHAVGGLAELVRHRETGLLLDSLDPAQWAQQIHLLAQDPALRRHLSTEAARSAQRYSWDSTAAQAVTAYRAASRHIAGTPR